jgi:hypothetical protein
MDGCPPCRLERTFDESQKQGRTENQRTLVRRQCKHQRLLDHSLHVGRHLCNAVIMGQYDIAVVADEPYWMVSSVRFLEDT